MKRFVFTKDTRIQDALELGDAVVEAFKRLGLKCRNCVAAEQETLFHAALYHETDLQKILDELNKLNVAPLEEEERGKGEGRG